MFFRQIIFACFSLCLFFVNAGAQYPPVAFSHITSSNGLPQNTGRVLWQDSQGYVWVGTEDGLVRFDGYGMRMFRRNLDAPASLSDNYISALAETADGVLWVGTMGGGVNRIFPHSNVVERVGLLSSGDVRALLVDDDSVWAGTEDGLVQLRLQGNVVVQAKRHVFVDADGEPVKASVTNIVRLGRWLWVSSPAHGLGRLLLSDVPETAKDDSLPSSEIPSSVMKSEALEGGSPQVEDSTAVSVTASPSVMSPNAMSPEVMPHDKLETVTSVFVHWFAETALPEKSINTLHVDHAQRLWIGGETSGLYQVINAQGADAEVVFKSYPSKDIGLTVTDVMAIEDAGNGRLWLGTWNGGLYLFDPLAGSAEAVENSPGDPHALGSNIIVSILRARDGKVWLGTFDRGVSWFEPQPVFQTYRARSDGTGLAGNLVWCFAPENGDGLWVGTGKGLSYLHLPSHTFSLPQGVTPAPLWDAIRQDDIRAVLREGPYLWIAGRRTGLVRLDVEQKTLVPFAELAAPGQELTHSYVRLLFKDSRGDIWIGCAKGANRFTPATGRIRQYLPAPEGEKSISGGGESAVSVSRNQPEHHTVQNRQASALPHYRVRALHEDGEGHIWVGTSDGVAKLDAAGDVQRVWRFGTADLLPGSGVRGIAEDRQGRMWFATEGGVAALTLESGDVWHVHEKDGLTSSATYSVIPYGNDVWVSTLRGIVRITPESRHVESYLTSDGLPDNECNFNAWCALPSGLLAFGTVSGMVVFDPQDFVQQDAAGNAYGNAPPMVIDSLRIGTKLEPVPLAGGLHNGQAVVVPWEENRFSIQYSALHFGPPEAVEYSVMLKGLDSEWNAMGTQHKVNYAGLKGGDYAFWVQARDRHGRWIARTGPLKIHITMSPWETPLAYALYALAASLCLFLLTKYYTRMLRAKAVMLENVVAERTRDLAESNERLEEKNAQLDRMIEGRERLFRAVSHELRTPLSVIVASLTGMECAQCPDSVRNSERDCKRGRGRIKGEDKRNAALAGARRLQRLLDTILELARNAADTEQIGSMAFDVPPAVEETLGGFRSLAGLEDKTLVESVVLPPCRSLMDREQFGMVLSNLLSNACKYTVPGGTIRFTCSAAKDFVTIIVEDDGIGISDDKLEYVFDWFERGDGLSGISGWGIGLAFVRDSVEKAGGSVAVESEEGLGSKFVVRLPVTMGSVAASSDDPLAAVSHPDDVRNSFSAFLRGGVKSFEYAADDSADNCPPPDEVTFPDTVDGQKGQFWEQASETSEAAGPLRGAVAEAGDSIAGVFDAENADMASRASVSSVEAALQRLLAQTGRDDFSVVLVEDDADLRQVIVSLLPESWHCRSLPDAEEGWLSVLEHEPDIVITDVMLSGESGFEFTRRLKEDERTAHLPVIILTALGGEEHRLAGLELSADSFMSKPFTNSELLLRVIGMLANRERVRERMRILLTGAHAGKGNGNGSASYAEDNSGIYGHMSAGRDSANGASDKGVSGGLAAENAAASFSKANGAGADVPAHASGSLLDGGSGDVLGKALGENGYDEHNGDGLLAEITAIADDPFVQRLQRVTASPEDMAGLTLEEVAARLNMSTRSLQREMGRIGMTWSEYRRMRRIQIAMELLATTDDKIGLVAERAGYQSSAHFNKIFKELTGYTPSVWRSRQ